MIRMPREFYIPKGAVKVADKKSDAVAYLYNGGAQMRAGGKPVPCLRVFYGKQAKPVAAYQYPTEAKREEAVRRLFEARQAWAARKADERAKRNAAERKVEVGTLLYTCWGYDQTNYDYYEVTALVGTKMVEVRPIAASDVSNGTEAWMTGKSIPKAGAYTGPAKRVRFAGGCKIDGHFANVWDGMPNNWTSYA